MSGKKEKIITASGVELTEQMMDRLAHEWESDTWKGRLTEITVGRPRIMGEELVNVTFRIPKSRLSILEAVAKSNGETRSEYLRKAVDKALVADIL